MNERATQQEQGPFGAVTLANGVIYSVPDRVERFALRSGGSTEQILAAGGERYCAQVLGPTS